MYALECRVKIIGCLYDYIDLHPNLKEVSDVYVLFETLKAKYFDRILYFRKIRSFNMRHMFPSVRKRIFRQ